MYTTTIMLKIVPSSLQLAAVTILLYLTLKGVSPRVLNGNNIIRKAVTDLYAVQGPWRTLSEQYGYFENENLNMDRDYPKCADLNLNSLPSVIQDLGISQRYTHFMEGPDLVFETNCVNFQSIDQQHGRVTHLIDVLINHLTGVMRQCSGRLLEPTSINCTAISNDSVQFLDNVELSLRNVRDFFHG